MSVTDLTASRRTGRNVFAGLTVATAVEFVIATARIPGALGLILAIAFFKAWLIVVYFMHIHQLREEVE